MEQEAFQTEQDPALNFEEMFLPDSPKRSIELMFDSEPSLELKLPTAKHPRFDTKTQLDDPNIEAQPDQPKVSHLQQLSQR